MKNEREYPVYSVTRSYSQKLNRGNYETSDFFASRSYSWFAEPTLDEIKTKSQELFIECKEEVLDAVEYSGFSKIKSERFVEKEKSLFDAESDELENLESEE